MWQVSGRSDITDFEEVVRLDTEYISNWNFGLDIKILFKTVIMVLKRKDRYEENSAKSAHGMQRSMKWSGFCCYCGWGYL